MQLRWIGLFYGAYFAFVGLYSPFLGPYLKFLNHSLDVVALALGLMQVMRIFGPFFWGWVSDHSHARVRWLRLGSLGGLVFSVIAFSWAENSLWLIAMLAFLNFFISGLVPLSDAHAMDVCEGCSGQYGKVRLYGSIGFIASVVLYGQFAQHWSMSAYPVWVALTLLVAFLGAMQFSEADSHQQRSGAALPTIRQMAQTLMGNRRMRWFWVASFFMILAHGAYYAYFSLYLLKFGYSTSTIGYLWAIGVVCEVVFFALQGRFFKYLSLVGWLRLTFVACILRFALVALFPEFLGWLLFAQALHCLTFAAHHTATVAWLRQAMPARLLVRGQALYATIAYGLGGTLGTGLGRVVWSEISPSAVFWMAAISGLLALYAGFKLSTDPLSQQKLQPSV